MISFMKTESAEYVRSIHLHKLACLALDFGAAFVLDFQDRLRCCTGKGK